MNRPLPPPLLLLSGISGAGKSIALKTLEDSGYYCIDNLPVELLADCLRTLRASEGGLPELIAVAIDVRSRSDLADMPEWLASLGRDGHDPQLVFIDCDDESLLRRYADTRRRHPLTHLGLALGDAIALERQVLKPLNALADVHIDSSALNLHQLRRAIIERLGVGHDQPPALLLQSFAYKRGLPADADFVFDARVLPNPHWNPELRPLSGRDPAVRAYFETEPQMQLYLSQVRVFLDAWLPRLRETTRSYITIAFGCSGGRHRSVYLAESIATHLRERGWPDSATYHREQE